MRNFILSIVMLIAVIVLFIHLKSLNIEQNRFANFDANSSSCSLTSCGIDPVSEPDYNMKQIAKQSILLEEHISQPQKRCRDCIIKHFLHIIGLAEEALWLACKDVKKFPYLDQIVDFYNNVFIEWQNTNESNLSSISDKLRDMRKKIVAAYFAQTS